MSNSAPAGGAISASFPPLVSENLPQNRINITCKTIVFDSNYAVNDGVGGGLFIVGFTLLFNGNTTVKHNFAVVGGWMQSFDSTIVFEGKFIAWNNKAAERGGTISFQACVIYFSSRNTFQKNKAELGGTLYMTESTLHLRTVSQFKGNNAQNGGAIYVGYLSKIHLYDNSKILFKQNRATRKGGAIFVADDTSLRTCNSSTHSGYIQYTGWT